MPLTKRQRYYRKNRESEIRKVKEWRANNREKVKAYQRNYDYLRKYGITAEQYDAMVLEREGRCDVCRREFSPLEVDHCHTTGKIRGLLCESCNLGLGKFADNPDALRAAAEYLENAQ